QRHGRRARREWLVHVDEVERRVIEERLDRARDVDRHRHAAATASEDALPDRQDLRAPLAGEDTLRVLPTALDRRARLPDELPRFRRRDHHHAVAAPAELVREPLDEAVYLVVLLPGIRRDLGDREGFRRHPPPEATPSR